MRGEFREFINRPSYIMHVKLIMLTEAVKCNALNLKFTAYIRFLYWHCYLLVSFYDSLPFSNMSKIMRKPAFCIYEKKAQIS